MSTGDKVFKHIYTDRVDDFASEKLGTVIFVNESHGWYTAEFDISGTKIRESYWMGDLE